MLFTLRCDTLIQREVRYGITKDQFWSHHVSLCVWDLWPVAVVTLRVTKLVDSIGCSTESKSVAQCAALARISSHDIISL